MTQGLFCGCCGNPTHQGDRSDPDWCSRCRTHVVGGDAPPWQRTWFARYRTDCPFQVK